MAKRWVELRIHGVSGTPPESMLAFAHVKQVAGDEFGRYFRRFDEHGDELPGHDGQHVEAYHWGKFTSGSWSQAIWLLLAPFGIINAAQFTLEPPSSGRARFWYAVASAMLRFVGLALTVLFVLGAAVISLDLWAWQRIDLSPTVRDRFILAVALLAPVAVLAMCFVLGRSRLVGHVDAAESANGPAVDDEPDDARFVGPFWQRMPPSDLVRPAFLGGDARAPALRLLHLAAGLSVVGVLGFAPRRNLDDLFALVGFWTSLGLLTASALCVILLGDPERSASVAWTSPRLRRLRRSMRRWSPLVGRVLASVGGMVVVGAVVHNFALPADRDNSVVHYPGIDLLAYLTMSAAVAGMITLVTANGLLARGERHSEVRRGPARFRPFAYGMGATLLTSLGVFVGIGYVGAFGVTAAKALETPDREVQAPELMTRVVYAWGITAFVLVGLAVIGAVRQMRNRRELQDRATADFTRADGLRVPARWISHIASAVWAARLKNSLVSILTTFALVGWILSGATGYELMPQLRGDDLLWDLPGWLDWLTQPVSINDPATGFIMWVGTLTLTGLAAALVFVGRTAIAGEAARRSVNVLWDVIAFWPRSAHPFVPPAYSQRAVKDLEQRIAWHLAQPTAPDDRSQGNDQPGRPLVLCAHSQGSLLSFAALLRMATSTDAVASQDAGRRAVDLDDLGFLTAGSQLQVLFSRAFPAYVNLTTIGWLFGRLGGAWRSLYRDTDYLAGPVLSWDRRKEPRWFGDPPPPDDVDHTDEGGPDSRQQFGADWRLLDPPLPDGRQHEHPLDLLRRHSDYWTDLAWDQALDEIRPTPPARDADAEAPAAGASPTG